MFFFQNIISVNKDCFVSLGIISFLIVATVSNTVTTIASYSAISFVRTFFFFIMVTTITLIFLTRKIYINALFISMLFLIITTISTISSIFNSSLHLSMRSLLLDTVLITSGMLLFFADRTCSWRLWIGKFFICYAILTILFTVSLGGIVLTNIPRFFLEYGSELIGREEDYSLGISFFYGLSSILAILEAARTKALHTKIFYLTCSTLFFLLCFMGGGRGEILATILILVAFLTFKKPILFVIILFFLMSISFLFTSFFSEVLGQFVVLERFRLFFDGDMSQRDVLIVDAINLIQNNPNCLLLGCGFSFFQSYYAYDFGLYPHNSIFEAIIVFGLPLTMLAVMLLARGIVMYYKQHRSFDSVLVMFVFTGLISLKSNYLYGNWLLLTLILYFIALPFHIHMSNMRCRVITH